VGQFISDNHCTAPSGVDAPRLSKTYTDNTVTIKLKPSRNEALADVTHYLVMVVPEEMARNKSPTDFRLEEVNDIDHLFMHVIFPSLF